MTVEHPKRVLFFVVGLTLVAGLGIPLIESDPAPEKVGASHGDYERDFARFRESFGDTDQVLLVVVSAPDVLANPALDYVAGLTGRLQAIAPEAVSLTHIALPFEREEDLDSLDDSVEPELSPSQRRALQQVIDAEPHHFPRGMLDVAQRQGGFELRNASDGELDGEMLQEALERAPMARRVVSNSGQHTLIVLPLAGERTSPPARLVETLEEVRAIVDSHPAPDGVQARVGGLPSLRATIVSRMQRDQLVLIPAAVVLCLLVLFASLRSARDTLLPLLSVASAAAIWAGVMGWVGVPMTILNSVVPMLILVIGIADGVHLVLRYRQERQALAPQQALQRTVAAMTVACFLTSVTTAVGMGSLVLAETHALGVFGLSAALGVGLAFVVTVLLVPSLVALWPDSDSRAGDSVGGSDMTEPETETETLSDFRPRSESASNAADLTPGEVRSTAEAPQIAGEASIRPKLRAGGGTKGAPRAIRHPKLFTFAGLLAGGLGLALSSQLDVSASLLDQLDEADEDRVVASLLEAELGGFWSIELFVECETDGCVYDEPVRRLLARFEDDEDELVLSTLGPMSLLADARGALTGDRSPRPFVSKAQVEGYAALVQSRGRALGRFVTSDARRVRAQRLVRSSDAKVVTKAVETLRSSIAAQGLSGVRVSLVGDAVAGSVGLGGVITDLLRSLGGAALIIFAFIALLMRSVRWAVVAIPSNVIPLALVGGYMSLRGIPLNANTAVIFSVGLGLAVDGSIHMLARMRELEALSPKEAAAETLGSTGRAIAISFGTLALGFSIFLTSGFVPVRQFGELISVMATFCLVSTLWVQPAIMVLLGDWLRASPSTQQAISKDS